VKLFDKLRRRPSQARAATNAPAGPVATPAYVSPASAKRNRDASEPEFPHFRATAGDQIDPTLSDRLTALRLKLRSAYTTSQPIVDRRMFAGRAEVLASLIRSIEDQRLHTVIYGDRGIGKTSILHVLAQAARDARYLVIYVSTGTNSDFDEVFRSIAAKLPLLYHADFGPTSPEAERGDTLADILPATPISVRVASDYCTKLVGTRALILVDEFDRSGSAEFKRNIAEFLKNLSDRQVRVQLVIAGVAANLTEILAEIPSIRRNIFAAEIPRMSAEEIRQLVRKGEVASGLTFEPAAVEFIVSVANGFPYLASLLCQYVGLAALDEARMRVIAGDVATAISEVLLELRAQLSPQARARIGKLVSSGGHSILGRLAGYAKMSNGVFNVNAVDQVYPNAEAAGLCRSMLAELAADGGLIASREDDSGLFYRFIDANVPQYLWLMAEQTKFGGAPPARPTLNSTDAGAPTDLARLSNA
jgi:Cdc6-like AAA superfamily ATPase